MVINKQNNKESIFAGILKYSVSSLANLVIGFLSVLITTRILLPEIYGQITLFISTSTVIMYIITFGLDSAYIRFFNEPPNQNTSQQLLYKNLIITTTICFISGLLIYCFWGSNFSNFIWKSDNKTLIVYLFIYTFCQIILRYFNITFRMGFKAKAYNLQNILINCLSRTLIILGALYKNDFFFIASIITVGYLIIVTTYAFLQRNSYIPYNNKKEIDYSISLKGYGNYLKFAFFSAPTYIVFYANTMLSQQIISYALTAKALGIFSSTGVFGSILRAVSGGFANYWSAYVYKNYKDEENSISKMHDYIFLITILATSIMIICRDIIYLVIGSNYHESKIFFSLLLIFPILQLISETTAKGIQLANKNHITLITHTISVFINLSLSYIWVRKYGLKGVAYANAISGIFLYLSNTYFGQKYFKSIISISKSFLGLISIIAILSIPAFNNNINQIIIYVLMIDVITMIGYSNELAIICKKIKQFL